ncbi:hypothetical protein HYV86_05660 [Candidatus Woesearchaeota archaeon]|nr:hypothetical protein [Candidatus Woesearchaeota archaeon]
MAIDNASRLVARKTAIRELIESDYALGDDKNPSHLTIQGQTVQKVNVIAFVVHKENIGSISNLLLDDGTGRIISRFFEENRVASDSTVGDVLLLIGRVRVYNQERYLSPEIVKKVNTSWLQVRRLECKSAFSQPQTNPSDALVEKVDQEEENARKNNRKQVTELSDECVDEETVETQDNVLPSQKISKLIRDLDTGTGVFIEEILEKSPLAQTEQIIEKMLERGEIFQNQPGKVKVL